MVVVLGEHSEIHVLAKFARGVVVLGFGATVIVPYRQRWCLTY